MSDAIDYTHLSGLYDVYTRYSQDLPLYLQAASEVRGRILALMCGTGRVALPLIEEGAAVTCVDNSPAMLARLREKLDLAGLSAELVRQDVRELNLPSLYELAILPYGSFGELLTSVDQRAALEAIYRHLPRRGRFLCALYNPAERLQRADGLLRLLAQRPLLDRPGTLLVWRLEEWDSANDQLRGLLTFELYDENNILRSKRFQETRFALPDRDEFEEMASAVGFSIESLAGDPSGRPYSENSSPWMIWSLCR